MKLESVKFEYKGSEKRAEQSPVRNHSGINALAASLRANNNIDMNEIDRLDKSFTRISNGLGNLIAKF